jgi:hypothetical protein
MLMNRGEPKKMKSNFTRSLFCAGLALSTLYGVPARAQVADTFWSSIAAGCVPDRADLAAVDANHGTVSFATRKSGVIKLTCPVTFAVQPFGTGLTFGLTFYNDHGFEGNVDHCVIQAAFLRSNLNNVEGGLDIVDLGASGRSFVGRQVLVSKAAPLMDFSTSYYWIFVQLSRDSATATCNPILVGTFLSAVMQ